MIFFTFHGFKSAPIPKSLLIHPENAPRTTKEFPKDFYRYLYVGPAIEAVSYKSTRQRALVARLVYEYHSESGAIVQQEMTASIRDLLDSLHPEASQAAKALRAYYETHVVQKQNKDTQSSSARSKNASYHAATA